MVLGISTKVLRDYPLEEAVKIAGELGYGAVEFWVDDLRTAGSEADKALALCESYGMKKSVHLMTEDLNIASFNEGIRKESLRQQKDGIRLAGIIGAETATLHPGRKTAKTRTAGEAWKVQIKSILKLAKTAEESGVKLCVEGMEQLSGEFIQTPKDLTRVLEGCNHPAIGVTLDISHFQTIGDAVELLKNSMGLPVGNVHISQSLNGKPHLPVHAEEGEIDYVEAFRVLKNFYDDAVVVEGYVAGKGGEIAVRSIEWYKEIMTAVDGRIK